MIEAGVPEGCESEADASRLGHLFDAHHDRLYRLARRLSATRDEAQDLVQEAFLRAAAANRRVPPGAEAEEAWLADAVDVSCCPAVTMRKKQGVAGARL